MSRYDTGSKTPCGVLFSDLPLEIEERIHMELSGNDANRWEQISVRLQELATRFASYHEQLININSSLQDFTKAVDNDREFAERLSILAHKEVLRQESATLNAAEEDTLIETDAVATERFTELLSVSETGDNVPDVQNGVTENKTSNRKIHNSRASVKKTSKKRAKLLADTEK